MIDVDMIDAIVDHISTEFSASVVRIDENTLLPERSVAIRMGCISVFVSKHGITIDSRVRSPVQPIDLPPHLVGGDIVKIVEFVAAREARAREDGLFWLVSDLSDPECDYIAMIREFLVRWA